jgi:hypothetical protein
MKVHGSSWSIRGALFVNDRPAGVDNLRRPRHDQAIHHG